jgi:uncharacterized protein (TIGR03437 family)
LGLALAAPAADNKPVIAAGGIIDASNGRPGAPIAPGAIISIYGTSLSDSSRNLSATAIPLPKKLGTTTVTFGSGSNAVDAPLFGVYGWGYDQINAQVPWGVAPGSQPVTVTTSAGTSDAVTVTVQAVAPGVLSQASSGRGPGVVQVYDAGNYLLNDFTTRAGRKPATYGDIIVVYATGLGPVKQPPKDGDINAQPATGTITLKAVPPNGATITVGNTTYVFRDQPSATNDVKRTPDTTASGTLTFSAAPSLPSDGATVTITAGQQTAKYTFQTTPSGPGAVTLTPNVAARATLTFTSNPNAGNTVRIGTQTYTFQTVPSGTGAVALTPSFAAKATLTFNASPHDGDTVKIGTRVYTFRVLPSAPLDVRLTGDFTVSAATLASVINADTASLVQAVASTSSVVLTAKTAGSAGNSIQVSVSGTSGSFSTPTLTGGSDDLGATLTSLVSVINADNASPVRAVASTATSVGLTAKTAGAAGNSIQVIVSGTFGTPASQTLTGGSDGLGPTLTSLVSVITADPGSPVRATVSGTVVTLTAKSAGPDGNFTVAVTPNTSATYQAGAASASGIVATLDSLRLALLGNPAVTVDSAPGAAALTFHSAASGFAAISLTCTPGDASMACSIRPGYPLSSETTNTVKALVAGREVTAEYSGLAPGYVGLYQVNVKIPARGDVAFDGCFVPLQLKVTDASGSTLATSNTVTIAMAGAASTGADCLAGGGSRPNISEDIAAAATLFRLRQPDGKTKMGFRAAFRQTPGVNASWFWRAGFPPNGACITEVANEAIDLYSPVGDLIPESYPLLDAGTITVASGASSTTLGTIKPDASMFYSSDSLVPVTDDPASLSLTGTGGAVGRWVVPPFGPLQMVLRTKLTLSEPSGDASTGLKLAGTCYDNTGSVVAIVTSKDSGSGVNGATFCSTACTNRTFSITIKPDSLSPLPASNTANLDVVFVPAYGTSEGRVPFESKIAGEVVLLDGVSARPFTLPLRPTTP